MLGILQPHSVLLLVDALLDGIEDADVGGTVWFTLFGARFGFEQLGRIWGPHSCTDVNRALPLDLAGGRTASPTAAGPSAPCPVEEAAASSPVCCDLMGSAGCSRGCETPAWLPLGSLPGPGCAGMCRGESAGPGDPAVPGSDAAAAAPAVGDRAVLQPQRLLLFDGSAEEIFYVFIPAPCTLCHGQRQTTLPLLYYPMQKQPP